MSDSAGWLAAQRATESVPIAESVAEYAVAICRSTRSAPGVRLGASPRATNWLVKAGQAHAVLCSRKFVTPDDIKAVAIACISHRLMIEEGADHGTTIVRNLLETTPVPRP